MLNLRIIEKPDFQEIQNWPAYPSEFSELDYALRTNGWLTEFNNNPDATIYVAEQQGEIIAFSLLAKISDNDAEFRIALRADKFGKGLGRTISLLTIIEGFSNQQLTRIHLIARRSNQRAIRLYKQLGFHQCGICIKEANGQSVEFVQMDISGIPDTKW